LQYTPLSAIITQTVGCITVLKEKKKFLIISVTLIIILLITTGIYIFFRNDPWGFSRAISREEAALRMHFVTAAENYLGYNEANDSHRVIIDIYNSHEPLALGYEVSYEDSWCAAFVSTIAIQCKLTDIIPTECGCERQIGLFQELDCWEEKDSYLPLPGDLIYYAWDEKLQFGDCTGWSDHVGIVVGTAGPIIKVIEGNIDDCVGYRYIPINHPEIRGFGLPNFVSKIG